MPDPAEVEVMQSWQTCYRCHLPFASEEPSTTISIEIPCAEDAHEFAHDKFLTFRVHAAREKCSTRST